MSAEMQTNPKKETEPVWSLGPDWPVYPDVTKQFPRYWRNLAAPGMRQAMQIIFKMGPSHITCPTVPS